MERALEEIVTIVAGYGGPGAAILYLMWQNWLKDKRIEDLTSAAIERELKTVTVLTELATLVRAMGGRG